MKQLDARSRDIAKIAEAVHQLSRKRSGEVILTPSSTTTAVTDPTVTPDTIVLFAPLTASAEADRPYVLEANHLLGSFTITHTSDAAIDRKYRWIALGD